MQIEINLTEKALVSAVASATISYWGQCSYRGMFPLAVSDRLDGGPAHVLELSDLVRAVGLLASCAPTHLGHLMLGNADGDTGDLLIQLACFGEVKYG